MKPEKTLFIHADPWRGLKSMTAARIALGRCGSSLPSHESLDFKLSHARAKDAVRTPLDFNKIKEEIQALSSLAVCILHSAARDRSAYLTRPDLGARLKDDSKAALRQSTGTSSYDISLVVADGLSATAIAQNIRPFLALLLPQLNAKGYRIAPICLVEQGRVAVADEIADTLNAELSIICIGERPGLQSHNSMGIYMTYNARPGSTNDKRNCISNIRPEGLPYEDAMATLLFLIDKAFSNKISGVALKDDQASNLIE